MGYDYTKKLKPTGQILSNTCWAASISWWLEAMAFANKRRHINQVDLMEKFKDKITFSGAMSIEGIEPVCKSAEVRIDLRFVPPGTLKSDFNFDSPSIIIFSYPKVGGTHMNVIFNQVKDTVACMEPFFPYPGEDGTRTGQYVRRPLSFFGNSAKVGVGSLPLADAFLQLDQ